MDWVKADWKVPSKPITYMFFKKTRKPEPPTPPPAPIPSKDKAFAKFATVAATSSPNDFNWEIYYIVNGKYVAVGEILNQPPRNICMVVEDLSDNGKLYLGFIKEDGSVVVQ